ncbi:MAG: hypothetical protein GY821_10730 [Gammaproteobacteria bacterium]|nr:hypothetical protein [Gammaproteobacteria bacterium]
MKSCTAAAAQLLNYASNNFSKQYDYTTGKGLTPLGLGFTELTSIHAMVLTPPPTLVTTEIINDRAYLSDQLQRYQYYQKKYHQLLTGYPVAWDKSSDIYQTSEKLAQRADMAVNMIMSPDNPAKGALSCYNDFDSSDPTSCQAVTIGIKHYFSSLDHQITARDLTYLQPVKGIV